MSWTVLVASEPYGPRLDAAVVAGAIVQGLDEGGLSADACPLQGGLPADFDVRMRAAKAVVIVAPQLDEETLLGSLPFEIATRARQAGVPCYAVTRRNALSRFDARILDLQVVLEARSAQALREAGRTLADIV